MHKTIVLSMLAVTTVLALRYVSTFPVEGTYLRIGETPAQALESGAPSPAPASGSNSAPERSFDAEALRHLA